MQAKLFRVAVSLVPVLLGGAIVPRRGTRPRRESRPGARGLCRGAVGIGVCGRVPLQWRVDHGGPRGCPGVADYGRQRKRRQPCRGACGRRSRGRGNLADGHARSSVVYVDSAATDAQCDAVVAWLTSRAGYALGRVIAVRRAGVQFTSDASQVTVHADGAADLRLSRYPCSHCRMPSETWYAPLAPTEKAEVAQGISTGFHDKTLAVSWQQTETDNAFVGTFSL